MFINSLDKARLLRHFAKDPVLFSYHIGDLDDFHFRDCQWPVILAEGLAQIEEALLIYTGGQVPTVMAFGLTARFEPFLEDVAEILPVKFYCHYQKNMRPFLKRGRHETSLGAHLKMKLVSTGRIESLDISDDRVIRLNETHQDELQRLYDASYPGHYFAARMLQTGKYFGFIENDKIVSVAGVHVSSDEYNIAVLGNIVAADDYRGKGFARLVTGRLVSKLLAEEKLICLNVKADNHRAVRLYESLGFETVHEYEESLFEL